MVERLVDDAPLVSIIIPCFNAERWIRDAIESALDQTYPNLEVIVVNDGSSDNSAEILRDFGDRIQFYDGPNRGVCAANNIGLSLAKGAWVQFLGADDLLHPEKIKISLQVHAAAADIEFVWAPLTHVDEEFRLADLVPNTDGVETPSQIIGTAQIEDNALQAAYAPATAMFKRAFLEQIGPWNETLKRWTDLEYHARIAARRPRYISLDVPLYFYRQHEGPRISAANKTFKNLDDGVRALRLTHETLEENCPDRVEVGQYLAPFYLNLARSAAANGDKKQFQELLTAADLLRGERGFHIKCQFALACASVVGVTTTSVLIERVLRS